MFSDENTRASFILRTYPSFSSGFLTSKNKIWRVLADILKFVYSSKYISEAEVSVKVILFSKNERIAFRSFRYYIHKIPSCRIGKLLGIICNSQTFLSILIAALPNVRTSLVSIPVSPQVVAASIISWFIMLLILIEFNSDPES